MGYIGASADSAIGFADGGLLTGLGADIGKKYQPILQIGLLKILIHHLIELDISVILSVLLILTLKQYSLHSVLDGIIARILIKKYLLKTLFLFTMFRIIH